MFCPRCGSEYRTGFLRCSDCDVDLVEQRPASKTPGLVDVFETDNPALMPIVESLLRSEGIEYMKSGNTSLPELFTWGRFGAGSFSVVGPVKFYVRSEDAEEAKAVLERVK